MTDRLADETAEERELRLQSDRVLVRLPIMRDWLLRLLRRERPGYSLTEYW